MSETREVEPALPPAHAVDTADWHPKLVRLYRYWIALSEKAGGSIPTRGSFDPVTVPDLLSQIWLLDIEYEPTFRLRYRLLGTRIEHLLGRCLRGRWLDECHPHIRQHHDYFERYREVAATGVPSRRKKPPSFWHDKVALIENLVLPFSERGGRAEYFMVQTRFFRTDGKEV